MPARKDPLAEYRDKRSPDRTPEPVSVGPPAVSPRRRLQFVVQKPGVGGETEKELGAGSGVHVHRLMPGTSGGD